MASDNVTIVAEGVVLGEPFKVMAYTWETYPAKGVRFDIYQGGRMISQNVSSVVVLGFLANMILRGLDCVDPPPSHDGDGQVLVRSMRL